MAAQKAIFQVGKLSQQSIVHLRFYEVVNKPTRGELYPSYEGDMLVLIEVDNVNVKIILFLYFL